jgi:putative acetyltransferase
MQRARDPSSAAFTIRGERPADADLIDAVVGAAFGSPDEPRLVRAIRASGNFVPELSLVAELGGDVVGHVMVSAASLRDGDAHCRIATLSPLAVMPSSQRLGIGSALVREVIRRADDCGEPLVVLQGSPGFYSRLGFEYSVPHGIQMTLPTWAPARAAQMVRLSHYGPSIRGRVVLPPAFNEVNEH